MERKMEALRYFFSKTSENPKLVCLSAGDLEKVLTPEICLEALKQAYQNLALDPESEPKTLGFKKEGGSFHIKAGLFPKTRDTFAAKLNANFPGNPAHGLPTIQGLLVLIDAKNGTPLAIMDSGELTAIRTAATAALAATFGARKESRIVTFVGCGFQACYIHQALKPLFPLERVFAYDSSHEKARAFAKRFGAKAITDLELATLNSGIIITATTSKTPVLKKDMVGAGTFIAAMGADNKDKNELAPDLFAKAAVLVDDLEKCAAEGDLQQAVEAGCIRKDQVRADLCQLVSGARKGRDNDSEIVIFDSVGNGLQDVAAAKAAFAAKGP
jgi:ornithine cyclodeaminase/alanine dehydrogenase-like protein (mu-crystallin family)